MQVSKQSAAPPADTAADFEPFGPAVAIALNAEAADKPPDWIEVIPAGKFKGRDGRGPFDNADPQAVILATQALGMTAGLPIDRDHSTDFAAPEGREAPAAGWMREFQVRHGAIWARVEWTPRGAAQVASKEWAYVSPVFEHTKDDKQIVTRLLRAALTNNPNLELQAVAAAAARRITTMADKGGTLSDKIKGLEKVFPDADENFIIQLLEKANELDAGAAEDDDDDADDKGGGDEDRPGGALPAITARDGHAEGCSDEACAGECMAADEEMAREHAKEMHGADGEPTDAEMAAAREFLARHRKIEKAARAAKGGEERMAAKVISSGQLKKAFPWMTAAQLAVMVRKAAEVSTTPKPKPGAADSSAEVMALSTELAGLKQERALEKATTKVTAAIEARKLLPTLKEWGIKQAMSNAAEFDAYLAKLPVLLPNDPSFRTPPAAGGAVTLDKQQMEICTQLGLDPKKFVEYGEATKDTPGSGARMAVMAAGR